MNVTGLILKHSFREVVSKSSMGDTVRDTNVSTYFGRSTGTSPSGSRTCQVTCEKKGLVSNLYLLVYRVNFKRQVFSED